MIPRKPSGAWWTGLKKQPGGAQKRQAKQPRPTEARRRPFVEAMTWIARTAGPWRSLQERAPNWRSVYPRWRRWVRQAFPGKTLALLTAEHDPDSYAVDATYARVHAPGTRARGRDLRQAIGRSRSGLTSKVHLTTDALGFSCASL